MIALPDRARPVERPASNDEESGKRRPMVVDVVATLVMLLMFGDVLRMLFVDTEPHRDPVRRRDS